MARLRLLFAQLRNSSL